RTVTGVQTCALPIYPQGGQMFEAWGWDPATGKNLSRVALPPNAQAQAVQFLDHRLYAVFGYNQQPNAGFKVYDAVTGREARTLEDRKSTRLNSSHRT